MRGTPAMNVGPDRDQVLLDHRGAARERGLAPDLDRAPLELAPQHVRQRQEQVLHVAASTICIERIALHMPAVRFSCVSTTPLGTPVVPDV